MTDRRLLTLARMAEELDALESSAGLDRASHSRSSSAVLRPRPHRLGVVARIGRPLLTLAAGVAVIAGVSLWLRVPSVPPAPTNLTAIKPNTQSPSVESPRIAQAETFDPIAYVRSIFGDSHPAPSTAADESLVLAIVQDPHGEVQCVSWSRESAGEVEGMAPTALARQVCRADCVDGPHWLVAAKVTGPGHALPTGEAEMNALAACILRDRDARCDAAPSALSTEACVPGGLRVMVERRSMASR